MYPTLKEINQADRRQLALWYRHLPPPGTLSPQGTPAYRIRKAEEASILDRIITRFQAIGGFDPELSKVVGW